MIRQPKEPWIQAWLASVHLAASALALAWATTNLIAAIYHLERMQMKSVLIEAEEVLQEAQHGAK